MDIYALTPNGTQELKGGETSLDRRELEVMVLVDGRRSVASISALAHASDAAQVEAILERLRQRGLVRLASAADASAGFEFFSSQVADEAATAAAALKSNGYYVSIASRSRTPASGGKPLTVLIVEDEPLVAKYLKTLIEMEGHATRMAANRAQIDAALGMAPLPDLAILDVMLPDANGFEVLQAMKDDPRLSQVPVMMVTTQATRESVMKGLAMGADGYFTKPFEVETLVRGMKAVLGLA
jgi:two-component system OmpR family response regulator